MKAIFKISAIVVACCTLSSCQFFCICAVVLVLGKAQLVDPNMNQQNGGVSSAFMDWAAALINCVEDSSDPQSICPADGIYSPDGGFTNFPCTPGTIDPEEPSFSAPEASQVWPDPSQGQGVVESSPFTLPQNGSSLRRRTLGPRLNCTDPSNIGRMPCVNTNRENKPLTPFGGN